MISQDQKHIVSYFQEQCYDRSQLAELTKKESKNLRNQYREEFGFSVARQYNLQW